MFNTALFLLHYASESVCSGVESLEHRDGGESSSGVPWRQLSLQDLSFPSCPGVSWNSHSTPGARHQTAGVSRGTETRRYLMDDFKCVFFLFKILLCSLLFKSEHELNNWNTPLTNTLFMCLFILGMYAFILNNLYLTLTF